LERRFQSKRYVVDGPDRVEATVQFTHESTCPLGIFGAVYIVMRGTSKLE
jgi:hypothetical protein